MKTQIDHILHLIQDSFNGQPWYGDAVMVKLNSINFKIVDERIHDANSIANIVAHMIQWRIFTIEKIKGNQVFDIELNTLDDWPEITIQDALDWKKLIARLEQTQEELVLLISQLDDSFLQQQTLGRTYNNQHLLEGIIQHDIYHLGQIGILNSQLTKMN